MMVSPKESTLPFWFLFQVPCETLGMVSIPDSQCAPFGLCRIDLANNCHRNISLSQNEAAGVLATQNKHQRCISHCSIVFFSEKKPSVWWPLPLFQKSSNLIFPKESHPKPMKLHPQKNLTKKLTSSRPFPSPTPAVCSCFVAVFFSCQSC